MLQRVQKRQRGGMLLEMWESDKCQVFWMTVRGVTPRRLYCSIKWYNHNYQVTKTSEMSGTIITLVCCCKQSYDKHQQKRVSLEWSLATRNRERNAHKGGPCEIVGRKCENILWFYHLSAIDQIIIDQTGVVIDSLFGVISWQTFIIPSYNQMHWTMKQISSWLCFLGHCPGQVPMSMSTTLVTDGGQWPAPMTHVSWQQRTPETILRPGDQEHGNFRIIQDGRG